MNKLLFKTSLASLLLLLSSTWVGAKNILDVDVKIPADNILMRQQKYESKRPPVNERLFQFKAIEKEIDSLCYPIRLAYQYWQVTGDTSIFDEICLEAIQNILKTFKNQQRKDGLESYKFQRETAKAFTSQDDDEIKACVKMLTDTDANTGFIYESFYKDNLEKFTKEWFAWQNTLFGELILKLINEEKLDLLNSKN